MALEKLQALTAHLVGANLVDQNQVDSWMEDGRLVPAAQHRGNGYLICRFDYTAVVSLERFSRDERLLMALVCAWLHDHDPTREDDNLAAPRIDVDVLDNCRADVEIQIDFREGVELVADDNGAIEFNGTRWSLAPVIVDIAEEAAVGHNPDEPTDQPYNNA